MSGDRICTITYDLSGIRLRCSATGAEISWPTPIDVAHAFAIERYRALDLQARINAATGEIGESIGKSTTAVDDILREVQRILTGP